MLLNLPKVKDDVLVIYHGNCQDGYGSAWVCHKVFGNEATYIEGMYSEPYPQEIKDKVVYLVDFSFKRDVIIEMASLAKKIIVIDHHKSAQSDLVNLPSNVSVTFDMEYSGTYLCYQYFFPNKPIPKLVEFVSDRDTFKLQYKDTEAISSYLFSKDATWENWDKAELALQDPNSQEYKEIVARGESIREYQITVAKVTLKEATHDLVINGHTFKAINVPKCMGTDCCRQLMKQGEPHAAYYSVDNKKIVIGLRSSDASIDVSKLASLFNGGGHRNSSGFTLSINTDLTQPINPK